MPHAINSCALTGEKPCINKAIYVLLMHGYATFNMIFAAVTRCVLPGPRTSIVGGNYVCKTSVKRRSKIVQKNNAKCNNFFSFYAIIAIKHGFSNALTFARSLGSASVFNTSHGTWRMLMHEKPCLIPILTLH